MTKEQSQIMKGVAILLMIFLHLFNSPVNVDLCHNLLFVGAEPFVLFLSKASNPVPFFLLLGGYGLYKVYQKGDKNRWSRLFKLYMHWWIILIIFVTIGCFIKPSIYPGSFSIAVENITGFHTTYNNEVWFLLPYVVLSICAPWFFKLVDRCNAAIIVIATLMLHIFTSFCISRYGESFLYVHWWIYEILLPFHLLFSFSLGAVAAKIGWFEKLKKRFPNSSKNTLCALTLLLILIAISCVFKYNFFYAFLFISCFSIIGLPNIVKKIFISLGNNSMNMWMIHTWFCYYLFKDFIYSFSYPILIFIVLTIISYLCAILIDLIAKPIESLFITKRQVEEKPIL